MNPAPSSLKTDAWEHFGFKKKERGDLDKSLVVCKLCHTNVKYYQLTSPPKGHHLDKVTLMLTEPRKTLVLRCDPKQTRLNSDGGCSLKFPSSSPRLQKITEFIAYFICQDLRPYSMVENTDFRCMVNTMEPHHSIATRKPFKGLCSQAVPLRQRHTSKPPWRAQRELPLRVTGGPHGQQKHVPPSQLINTEWELVTYILKTRDVI